MTNEERVEIVNAARSYERIVAERRGYFVNALQCHKMDQPLGTKQWRQRYDESKPRADAAEALLAGRIYGPHDFVRVDGIIYMAYSTRTLLRIPVGGVPDLAVEPPLSERGEQ